MIPALEKHHEVLAVTLADHWGGPKPPSEVQRGVYALADAVERDLDSAGISTAHIAGTSLGAWVAFELAKRGRARTLTAIAPAGGWPRQGLWWQIVKWMYLAIQPTARLMARHPERWSRRPNLRRLLYWHHFAHPESLTAHESAHLLMAVANWANFRDLIAWVDEHGGARDLDQITCPVLLAFPEKDRILPRRHYGEQLVKAMPDAEVVDLPGVGHAPMYDDPDLVAETILSFAAAHSRATSAGAPMGRKSRSAY